MKKYKKKVLVHEKRKALLATLDTTSTQESRDRWQEQLSVVYRERSIDLRAPQTYNAKYMDTVLNSAYISVYSSAFCYFVLTVFSAPDLHQAEVEVIFRDKIDHDEPGLAKLVINGLTIQIEQYVFIQHDCWIVY